MIIGTNSIRGSSQNESPGIRKLLNKINKRALALKFGECADETLSTQLVMKLDLDGVQASEALKISRVFRAYSLLKDRGGISIYDQMIKNHRSLLERLHGCPLLPAQEKEAIEKERGSDPYLTDEEFELIMSLLKTAWKLSHTTDSIEPILQENKLLSLHQRKLESRETKSNANTPDDGTIDNLFFSCGVGSASSPDFLKKADTIIEVDWKQAAEASPKKFIGMWGSDHFYRYQSAHRCPPRLLGGTHFHLIYRKEVVTEDQERHSVKEYWFIREDGRRILFSINKGDEISIGESIREAMLLRFIELIRLAGPKFRRHVLDQRNDPEMLAQLFEVFFGTGEFEIHIPGKFSLKNREGIRILSNEVSMPSKCQANQEVVNQKLLRAAVQGDYFTVQGCIKQGADINFELEGRPLITYVIEGGNREMLSFLLDLGAEAVKSFHHLLKGDKWCTFYTPLDCAICFGNFEAVKLLVGYGSQDPKNPAVRNLAIVEQTNLFLAIKYDATEEMLTYLLDNLIGYPEAENYALAYCCTEKNLRLLGQFLNRGLDPNWRDTKGAFSFPLGTSAMSEAVKNNFAEGIALLVDRGADVNVASLVATEDQGSCKYYGHAVIIAKNLNGERSVLLFQEKGEDWVSRLSFPKGKQNFARDSSLLDSAKWVTKDLTGIDLSKTAIKPDGQQLFSEEETQIKQQYHLFELETTLPTFDLRLTRDCPPAIWVKLIDLQGLYEGVHNDSVIRCHYEGIPVSSVAAEFLRELEMGEVPGRVAHAILCEREGFALLSAAVKDGNGAKVQELIRMGVDPNAEGNRSYDGTALLQAFKLGNEPMAGLLVSLGASLNVNCLLPWFMGGSISLLSTAIQKNSLALVEFLVELGAPEFNDPLSVHTAACEAAKSENPQLFGFFLQRCGSITRMSQLLDEAATYGRPKNVEQLLRFREYGLSSLKSAILAAAASGRRINPDYRGSKTDYLEIMRMLLRIGSYDDETLNTVLNAAIEEIQDSSFVQELIVEGATDNIEKSSSLLEKLCWVKYQNVDTECAIAVLLRSCGHHRYTDLLAQRALAEDKWHLWQLILDSGDLHGVVTFVGHFLEDTVKKNVLLAQLVQHGFSVDVHDWFGKTFLYHLIRGILGESYAMNELLLEVGLKQSAIDESVVEDSFDERIIDALHLGANPFHAYFCKYTQEMKSLIDLIDESRNEQLKSKVNKWLLQSPLATIYAAYRSLKNGQVEQFNAHIKNINSNTAQAELLGKMALPLPNLECYPNFSFDRLLEPISENTCNFYLEKVKDKSLRGVELFWLIQHTFPNMKILFAIDKSGQMSARGSLQQWIIRGERQLWAHLHLKKSEFKLIFQAFPECERLLSFIVVLSAIEEALCTEEKCPLSYGSLTKQILNQGGFSENEISFVLIMLSEQNFLSNWMLGKIPASRVFKGLQAMTEHSPLSLGQCRDLKMLMELCKEYGKNIKLYLRKYGEKSRIPNKDGLNENFSDVFILEEHDNFKQLQNLIKNNKQFTVNKKSIETPSKALSYLIAGNPAPSRHGLQSISLPIARLPHDLTLSYKNLGAIFELANAYTCNTPYPLRDNSFVLCGIKVHRSNHNGTHGSRQVRYLEELFALIAKAGNLKIKELFALFDEKEILNMMLGVYFLRAGRVDESSHIAVQPDDYYTRSAMIYAEYAKQLGVANEQINWMRTLIQNSCKPKGVREAVIDQDPRLKLGYELLTLVHELDLVRCYGERKFTESNLPAIKERIAFLIGSQDGCDQWSARLILLTKKACEATGTYSIYHQTKGDRKRFALCSTSGKVCWEFLKNI